LKPAAEMHLVSLFRLLLRLFPLTCPGTPAGNFLAWNENSTKLAFFSVFRHALKTGLMFWRKFESCGLRKEAESLRFPLMIEWYSKEL
jgi:hypothetical protein